MIGERIAAVWPLPEGAAAQFDAYDALLRDWNGRMDLTAITDAEDALARHYLDSLTAQPFLADGAKVIDVGTGAGFPGMPLKLARPDLSMTLLDALQKRVDFLQHCIQTIPVPGCEAVHARVEDYARAHRETFDVAVSRAVAPVSILMEWMLPLVRVGGQCILWKGPGAENELVDGQRVAGLLGGGEIMQQPTVIPGHEDWAHRLLIVTKLSETPDRFPRRAGMAQKRPL